MTSMRAPFFSSVTSSIAASANVSGLKYKITQCYNSESVHLSTSVCSWFVPAGLPACLHAFVITETELS